jgi:ankyrin repeat protein
LLYHFGEIGENNCWRDAKGVSMVKIMQCSALVCVFLISNGVLSNNNQESDAIQEKGVAYECEANKKFNDLHAAVQKGDLEQVKQLINYYDLDEQEPILGKTVLHIAIERGLYTIAFLLIENGADVNIPSFDSSYPYPLHLAVMANQMKLTYALLKAGAHVNNIAPQGRKTALHRAASIGSFEIVVLLVKYGADVKLKDANKQTAYDIAESKGWQKVSAYLKNKNEAQADASKQYC